MTRAHNTLATGWPWALLLLDGPGHYFYLLALD
jgi:hypothetical protein